MPWVLLAIQFLLAAVFLLAAAGKGMRPNEFVSALRVSRLPDRLVLPLSTTLPVAEAGVAGVLLVQTPQTLRLAFGVAAVMFGAFTAWMAWIRRHGLRVTCGCFGTGKAEIDRHSIGRNVALLVLAIVGVALARRESSPLPGPSFWLAVTATAGFLVTALLVAVRTVWPELVLSQDRLYRDAAVRER
jgi:hypothetical protein